MSELKRADVPMCPDCGSARLAEMVGKEWHCGNCGKRTSQPDMGYYADDKTTVEQSSAPGSPLACSFCGAVIPIETMSEASAMQENIRQLRQRSEDSPTDAYSEVLRFVNLPRVQKFLKAVP